MDKTFLLLTFCALYSTISAQDLISYIDQDRTVDSYYCIIGRFCYKENAVLALTSLKSLDHTEARSLVDLYFDGSNSTEPQPRSCDCSEHCHIQNECCTDAGVPIAEVNLTQYTDVQCSQVSKDLVYFIKSCPEQYKIEAVTQLCEQEDELLVSSNLTYFTYKNIYCGFCNGELKPNLLGWTINYECLQRGSNNNITDTTNMTLTDLASKVDCFKDSKEPKSPPVEIRDAVLRQYSTFKTSQTDNICDIKIVQTCPHNTADDLKKRCEMGGASLFRCANDDTAVYRNQACAQCNNISHDSLRCDLCGTSCSISPAREPNPFLRSFAIFVQPFSNRETACSAADSESCPPALTAVQGCPENEYLDFKTITCNKICPYPTIYINNTCQPPEDPRKAIIIIDKKLTCAHEVSYSDYLKLYSASTGVRSVMRNGVFYMYSPSGHSNVTCHKCLRTMLVEENRVVRNNESITLEGIAYNEAFAILNDDDHKYRICEPDQSTLVEDYDRTRRKTIMEILTLVLCLLSILCLILFFIAFFLIKHMRNLPGCIVAGMMLMFLFAYIFFLSRYLLDESPSSINACYAVSVIIDYFFVAAFIFTISYSVMILQSLEFMELDSECLCTTIAKYWSPGVVIPAIIVATGILLDKYYPTNPIAPSYGGENCFLGGSSSFALNSQKANETSMSSSNHRWGLVVFFIGPIALCLTVNLSIYITIICKLRNIAAATRQVRASHKEKVFLCFKLIAVMGLNWLPMIVACAYPDSFVAQLLFMIPSCLHGVFGFLVFIATSTNVRRLRSKISSNSKQPATSTLSGSTSNYTANTTASIDLPPLKRNRSPRPTPPTSLHNSPHLMERKISDPTTDGESGTDSPMSNVPLRPKCDFF